MRKTKEAICETISDYIPKEVEYLSNPQTAIPRIAKDRALVRRIEAAAQHIPTFHELHRGDARMAELQPASIHLIVTSPPYWTLKEYRQSPGQMGHIAEYDEHYYELALKRIKRETASLLGKTAILER
jgi:modification methylase